MVLLEYRHVHDDSLGYQMNTLESTLYASTRASGDTIGTRAKESAKKVKRRLNNAAEVEQRERYDARDCVVERAPPCI